MQRTAEIRTTRHRFPALLALASLAACSDVSAPPHDSALDQAERAIVTAALTDSVRNPESLRMRDLQGYDLPDGDRALCGEFDVTDDVGTYMGYTPFHIRLSEADVVDFELAEAATERCQQAASS